MSKCECKTALVLVTLGAILAFGAVIAVLVAALS
jgi:hypothetical protein